MSSDAAAAAAAAAASSLISPPMLLSSTTRPHGRHSSESDVDTPPKVEAAPFFEASPKGFFVKLFAFPCFISTLDIFC